MSSTVTSTLARQTIIPVPEIKEKNLDTAFDHTTVNGYDADGGNEIKNTSGYETSKKQGRWNLDAKGRFADFPKGKV